MALRGRLARKPYWIGIGLVVGAQAAAAAAGLEGAGWTVLSGFGDILIAALISRRMRDFGRSPIWGWLGMALAQFAAPGAAAIASAGSAGAMDAIGALLVAPPGGGSLTVMLLGVLIGAAGLARGDPGANRYGPPTDGPRPARSPAGDLGDDDASAADAVIARSLAALKTETNPRAAFAVEARRPMGAATAAFGKRR